MTGDRSPLSTAPLRLVYITDIAHAGDRRRIETVLENGVTSLWLRDPSATGRELFDAAVTLRALTTAAGAALWIGDRVDVALAVHADGVQLGHRAVPAARVRLWFRGRLGVSCHDARDLEAAAAAGADHVVISPVFAVPGKGEALGLDGLDSLLKCTSLPVVALGFITPARVTTVRGLGVAGVAVIRALSDAADPAAVARALAGMTTA